MAERRLQSHEGSRKREDEYTRPEYEEPSRMRSGGESPSSSSSSYIDISRTFPLSIRAFFTAPSERRRLRKRRSNRMLKHSNSSSSSINSDLAYGTGFIKRPKSRGVRSRKGKDIDRERQREHTRERGDRESNRDFGDVKERPGSERRPTTDAEIIAVGAGLMKIARDQNKRDLKDVRNGKRPEVIVNQSSSYGEASRGLGPSQVSQAAVPADEDGWESASDAESESSVDSRLAFNENTGSGWFGFGKTKHKPQSRKSTVVDPAQFGPSNSLYGIVTEPVGLGNVPSWSSSSDFGQNGSIPYGTGESVLPYYGPRVGPPENVLNTGMPYYSGAPPPSITNPPPVPYYDQRGSAPVRPPESVASGYSQPPLQHVYPMPTSDPSRFDVARSSVVSGPESYVSRSRQEPIPIQQPQPFTPVSQSVYEPSYSTRSDSGILNKAPSSSSRGKSLAEAALAGVAGAAVGAVIASDRKSDRKVRDGRDRHEQDDRDDRRREKDREERRERRRKEDRKDSGDKKREKRRDDGRDDRKSDRSEAGRSERSDEYAERRTKSETSVHKTPVDPFQYQVADDAFGTPVHPSPPNHERLPSIPKVYTVEREPDFLRKGSSSTKDQPSSSMSGQRDKTEWDSKEQRYVRRDSPERSLHDAITNAEYPEARSDRDGRREEPRGRSRSRSQQRERSRNRSPSRNRYEYEYSKPEPIREEPKKERDPIQEEADRAYREIVMARKIASQVIRSRSPSPDPSVVNKYEADDQEEIIRIVTPPGMEERKKEGPYDAPNADFKLDYVLEDPRDLRTFAIPVINLDTESPYLKLDPGASLPRPHLNLVRPTPTPSPMPEKQAEKQKARSEPAKPTKPTVEPAHEAVNDTKDSVVTSPTSSTVSKGVTWGENETKHYEVESSPEMRAREVPVQEPVQQPKSKPKTSSGSKGWGAIVAGITGAGVAAAASAKDSPKQSAKKENDTVHDDGPYEYRGVVVEPESSPRSNKRRSSSAAGPDPSAAQPTHVPGSFNDDLDFTATVAAGLQDTGFDPNIVINDPVFRRRDSPPGSNQPGLYRAPYAETVSDLGNVPGFDSQKDGTRELVDEVSSAPRELRSNSPGFDDTSAKLSKKDQKRRDKASKRQSADVMPIEEEVAASKNVLDDYSETLKLSKKEQKKRDKAAGRSSSYADEVTPFDEPSIAEEIVEEPESYFEKPKKSKSKKSKKSSSTFDEEVDDTKSKNSKNGLSTFDEEVEDSSRTDRTVSVPVEAFDDLRNGEDEWDEAKKSKKKLKRNSERFDSPSREIVEIASLLERSSSKKSKDKSRRKSEQYDYEPDPSEIALPPSTPSEVGRDWDLEDPRKSRKSSKRDSADRDDTRSVVSADTPRYADEDSKKSKKKSRSGTRDDFDDSRSVASAPAGDEFEDVKRSKKKDKRSSGGFFGLFGSKSEATREESPKGAKDEFEEVNKKVKKSKRSSTGPDALGLYGDSDSQFINDPNRVSSNGNCHSNGSHVYDDDDDDDRSRNRDGKKPSRSRAESTSSKPDSFLANAGTLGGGVGLAGAAVAIAAQHHQRSKAENANSNELAETTRSSGLEQLPYEMVDPEITERQFRPSIDPQYGDLLPLPPSNPASPNVEPIEDLPQLPDSRPDTPEVERLARERTISSVRKSQQETPIKSPSQSAVPLKFMMGNRSTPSSPGLARSPLQSPVTPRQTNLAFPRDRPRPTSWDSSKEYKPLYLVESNRRASLIQQDEPEEVLPSLPPSQRTSRSSSELEFQDALEHLHWHDQSQIGEPLSIDTADMSSHVLPDSQQTTPTAANFFREIEQPAAAIHEYLPQELPTLSALLDTRLPETELELPSQPSEHGDFAFQALTAAASVGYMASSPIPPEIKELRSGSPPRSPSPVDAMSKDRSSYLLQSSPLFNKLEESDHRFESPMARHVTSYYGAEDFPNTKKREESDTWDQAQEPNAEEDNKFVTESIPKSFQEAPDSVVGNIEFQDKESDVIPDDETTSFSTGIGRDIEPADDFSFTKSKKNKKKEKKKGKGIPHSSTLDDVHMAESSRDAAQDNLLTDTATIPEEIQLVTAPDILPLDTSKEISQEPSTAVEMETAEYSFTKSKKDKKKKKGLSRSATHDDILPEAIPDVRRETETPVNTKPAEEFSSTKSKKDKKKKGLSRSSTQDDISLVEQSIDISEKASTFASAEPAEEFSFTTSKKDKKKKKGLSRSSTQESITVLDTERTIPEDISHAENVVPVDEPVEDIFFVKSKKDEKKGKSTSNWEPEKNPNTSQVPQEPLLQVDQDLSQEVPMSDNVLALESKKGEIQSSLETREIEATFPLYSNRDSLAENTAPGDSSKHATTLVEDTVFQSPQTPELETGRESPEDFETMVMRLKEKAESSTWGAGESKDVPTASLQDTTESAKSDEATLIVLGTKKSKKQKKGKLTFAWDSREDEQSTLTPPPADIETDDEFQMPGSRKSKKKNKKTQAWDQEEEISPVESQKLLEEPAEDPVSADMETFSLPSSKKSKKSKLSQAWEPEPKASQDTIHLETSALGAHHPAVPEEVEEYPEVFATPLSRGGEEQPGAQPISVGQSDSRDVPREVAGDLATIHQNISSAAPETPSVYATPMGATPWTNAGESSSSARDYFPSAAAVHSPLARQNYQDSRDRGYFPSSGAMLPIATALSGGAVLGAEFMNTADHDNKSSLDHASSKSLDVVELPISQEADVKPDTRDGLKAGYDKDQLNLARQLQQEFGSSSKKSKKDKKKRQSLPSTPGSETPRSRGAGEAAETQLRARSLSIGPSRTAESGEPAKMIEERKSVYSEEQLELARQLKADFESGKDGNKKAKKDKKKRQSLVPESPMYGDPVGNYIPEDSQTIAPKHASDPQIRGIEGDTVKQDGFAAGYQEDQVALATQLQAEFGGGSKKSRKGKQSRSTSRTPLQESEPQTGYFGIPVQEPSKYDVNFEVITNVANFGAAGVADRNLTRDGLAASYKEDQFELARQLKEEIGSGSKKSKKDKKRESLLRGVTDDYSSSVDASKDANEAQDFANEVSASEKVLDEPENEFAFVNKKSKKDKKGKQRDSVVPSSDNSTPVDLPAKDEDNIVNLDAEEPIDAPISDIEDNSITSKKSKKDKKGKKRESILFSITSDSPTADKIDPKVERPVGVAAEAEPEPVDDWSLPSTKSKKDKKNRASLIRSSSLVTSPEEQSKEITSKPLWQMIQDISEDKPSPPTPEVDDQGTGFEFTTKNDKNDKNKRQILQPAISEEALNSAEEVGIVQPEPKVEEGATATTEPSILDPISQKPSVGQEGMTGETSRDAAVDVPATDMSRDSAFTPKKSKKDKEKRKDSAVAELEDNSRVSTPLDTIPEPAQPLGISLLADEPQGTNFISLVDPTTGIHDSVTPEVNTKEEAELPEHEWNNPSIKKSKKDKKKRKSGVSTPVEKEIVSGLTSNSGPNQPTELVEDKDIIEDPPPESAEPSVESTEVPKEEAAEQPEDEWGGYSVKKSKKDKKKRKSGLSTSADEILPVIEPEKEVRNDDLAKPPADKDLDFMAIIAAGLQDTGFDPNLVINDPSFRSSPTHEIDSEKPDAEWDNFSTKKSKKDKKILKSGTSTPGEQNSVEPATEPKEYPEKDEKHQTSADASSTSLDLPTIKTGPRLPSALEEVQEPEDYFEPVTKSSKKGKKNRKSGLSTPREDNLPVHMQDDLAHPIDIQGAPSQTGALFTSHTALEKSLPIDASIDQTQAESTPALEITEAVITDEADIPLARKESKKDKRKRQTRLNSTLDVGAGFAQPPLTSWADEVEEAEGEIKDPVIENIASDRALATMANATEPPPDNESIRPSKKGKKGSKRKDSMPIEPSLAPELSNPFEESEKSSDVLPVLAATGAGAALAGAALASRPDAPTRKLSKKEKRKMSIDKRTPQNDMFDDPALWEGAEPQAFEEPRGAEQDAGSDGFWAPPHGFQAPEESVHQGDSALQRSVHEAPTTALYSPPNDEYFPQMPQTVDSSKQDITAPLEKVTSHADQHSGIENRDSSDQPTSETQWNDLPDELIVSSSKKDKKKKEKSRLTTWDPPNEPKEKAEALSASIVSSMSEPPRDIVPPPQRKRFSFEDLSPTSPVPPAVGTTFESDSHMASRAVSFEESPKIGHDWFTQASSYNHPGASSLPVVREESQSPFPVDQEQEITHHSHDHPTAESHRDSAFVSESPVPPPKVFTDEHNRDSGVHFRDFSPIEKARVPIVSTDDALARLSWPAVDEETETVDLDRSQRSGASPSSKLRDDVDLHRSPHHEDRDAHFKSRPDSPRHSNDRIDARTPPKEQRSRGSSPVTYQDERTAKRRPSPLNQTRSASHHDEHVREPEGHHEDIPESRDLRPSQKHKQEHLAALQALKPKEDGLVKQRVQRIESPDFTRSERPKQDKYSELLADQRPKAERPSGFSDHSVAAGAAMLGASIGFVAARQSSKEQQQQQARPGSVGSNRSSSNINRLRTPDSKHRHQLPPPHRPDSVSSNRSSGTPPLRRSDRKSGDLRSLSQQSKSELNLNLDLNSAAASGVSAATANPTANEGRIRAKDMADVYDGFGEGRIGSPRSPTRPHSMRRRQSMQVLDLESRVEQLAAENRLLAEAKSQAEHSLQGSQHASSALVEKDAEIDTLKRTLDWLQNEVTRLSEVNDGLNSANITLGNQHNDRYGQLEAKHAQAVRELQEERDAHNSLSGGMEGIATNEIQNTVQDKDQEIAQLRAELDAAKEQIREMQRQILASKADDNDFLTTRDEDYFDLACQQLCQHVQQWVLRFSKFSDMRACRLTSEINNDKIIDRLDNAILDGSDVDSYLADRVKRRDVFMSMTMTMIWEFVFTRYLFGMDREQRQKLKSLERLLLEVGPPSAVHQWRATTLTLLSKRDAFTKQREQDTLAVVNAVMETLTEILPPPSHLEDQIQEQLLRVMKAAVDLSIEMRTQRAEYMMLPPLQPEYDANGDLASKVSFNAALMNERSGDSVSNEELEKQGATVRIVLFPLVIKKGNDSGNGDEEIVVCPAQVLVAKPKKTVRVFTPESMAHQNHSRVSMQSSMPAEQGEGVI